MHFFPSTGATGASIRSHREAVPAARARDKRVDALRGTGLLLIILAHVSPPDWLYELRNFDVPLMAFVAGVAHSLSRKNEPYFHYVTKRFKRLVVPTWLFLSFYFGFVYLHNSETLPYSAHTLESAYALGSQFPFVWIIRVFLVVALTGPWWDKLDRALRSNARYLLVVLLLLPAADVLMVSYRLGHMPGLLEKPAHVLAISLPYCALFGLGLRVEKLSKQLLVSLAVALSFIQLGLLAFTYLRQGHYISTEAYKYPPRLYYISYGAAASLWLWLAATRRHARGWTHPPARALAFVAENSLWLYLWHILFLYLTSDLASHWALRYAVVVAAAGAAVAVQRSLVNRFAMHTGRFAKDLRLIMTG